MLAKFALSALVLLPAAAQTVPTPESVLGHKPGDDFYLANYDESRAYFHRLAASSNRIKMISVGKTTRGLDWEIAIISSPQNLANLDKYKSISQRLAHGRGLTDETAKALARESKAIVHIDGGLHSTEVAGAQQSILLAYKMVATQGDPEIDAILDNVILMLWPTLNPDGQNEVVAWYRKNLGTPYEVSPLPVLYQEYVGHDNNRDGYMLNMLESRLITKATLDTQPLIFYTQHQTAPFPGRIYLPPFADPISGNMHPLMLRWLSVIGMSIAQYLDDHDLPGSMHQETFDVWYPGYIDNVGNFRNTISFFTETALYRYATPHFYTVDEFPQNRQGLAEALSYDGLQQITVKGIDMAFALPGATLSGYTQFMIDPVNVSFAKNWKPTVPGTRRNLSTDEIEKIRSGVAKIVFDVFVAELKKGGYTLASAAGPNVLDVKPMILNLYVTAPDVMTPGRTRTYTASSSEMTLVAELTEFETRQVVARVLDRQQARRTGTYTMSSSVSSASDARVAATSWASILRNGLDKAKTIGSD